MIVELGQFILALSLIVAISQVFLSFKGAKEQSFQKNALRASFAQAILLAISFIILIVLFLRSDFSLLLVAQHSHSTKPWFFKIAASWGNHEGSLLLWTLLLALFGAAFAFFENRIDVRTKFYTLAVQAFISVLFLSFLIFTSNPFMRLEALVFQGAGLNPVLEDVALIIHPPILYLGYVGFSIVFSIAAGGLLSGRIDKEWAKYLAAPIKVAWISLTIGIALGSWWAYRELGWGGFWFWDPVENASLMPWLIATALLHAVIVASRHGIGLNWVVLLAMFTFLFSVLGTFLTRSGLIVSVHSFASDPTRGLVLLFILILLLVFGVGLYIWKKPNLIKQNPLALISRESAIMGNSLFLTVAAIAVLTGTLYPIVLEFLTTEKIAVGAPYFETSFVPIMILPLMIMPLAVFFGQSQKWAYYFVPAFLVSFLGFFAWQPSFSFASFGFGLALWLIAGSLTRFLLAKKNFKREGGMLLAHSGLGVLLCGIIGAGSAQSSKAYAFNKGETIDFAAFTIKFSEVKKVQAVDYRAEEGLLLIYKNKKLVARLRPQIRHYIARPQPTREAAIYTSWLPPSDFHAILGDEASGKRAVQFYHNPLAPLLWLGAGLIGLGGVLSFRRK